MAALLCVWHNQDAIPKLQYLPKRLAKLVLIFLGFLASKLFKCSFVRDHAHTRCCCYINMHRFQVLIRPRRTWSQCPSSWDMEMLLSTSASSRVSSGRSQEVELWRGTRSRCTVTHWVSSGMTKLLGEGVKVINMIIALKLFNMASCYGNVSGNKCWMERLIKFLAYHIIICGLLTPTQLANSRFWGVCWSVTWYANVYDNDLACKQEASGSQHAAAVFGFLASWLCECVKLRKGYISLNHPAPFPTSALL